MIGTLEERFWAKVDKRGPDECWEWTAERNENGYGRIRVGGKRHYAHRVAWELERGAIPLGMCVCHICDNPACVNAKAHLFLGSRADNNVDMKAKGRQNRGERNGTHKLINLQVIEIRREYAVGKTSQRQLADKYGMCPSEISLVVNRKRWVHI